MITLTREEAQQVLDALEAALSDDQPYIVSCKQTIETIRARLSAPEPTKSATEPVVGYVWQEWTKEGNPFGIEQWLQKYGYFPPDAERKQVREVRPLYTAPPQREWQGLTDDDFLGLTTQQIFAMKFAEAKLREKNT